MSNVLQSALQDEIDTLQDRLNALLTAQTKLFGKAPAPTRRAEEEEEEAGEDAPRMKPAPTKRARLGEEDIELALAQIVATLEGKKDGLRIDAIKRTLDLDKRAAVKAIQLGLASDQITKVGNRRATKYFLPVAPSKAQAAGRVVRGRKK